jgi:hypothetical protein
MKHPTKVNHVAIGDVVLIRSEDRNRNNWPKGIVERLFEGKDVRGRTVSQLKYKSKPCIEC